MSKTILLIEDDITVRENTAELLELSGYKVVTAAHGKKGVELVEQLMPDIIICDIMMPELDGYGVLKAVSTNPNTKHIPFIFLSAKTEHRDVRKGMDLGADDYLTKPFEEDDLISAIESRLAKTALINEKKKEVANTEDELQTLNDFKNYIDDHGTEEFYKKGTIVFEQGSPANSIYLINKGVVKLHRLDISGKDLITALHSEDDLLGYAAILQSTANQESATALEDSHLTLLSKSDVLTFLRAHQSVYSDLLALLAEHLNDVKEQLLQMAYGSVRKKTAATILQFAEKMNKKSDEPLKISRNDLASVAGIATESLIRTLSSFNKEGLLVTEGRNIKIVDLEGLQLID